MVNPLDDVESLNVSQTQGELWTNKSQLLVVAVERTTSSFQERVNYVNAST